MFSWVRTCIFSSSMRVLRVGEEGLTHPPVCRRPVPFCRRNWRVAVSSRWRSVDVGQCMFPMASPVNRFTPGVFNGSVIFLHTCIPTLARPSLHQWPRRFLAFQFCKLGCQRHTRPGTGAAAGVDGQAAAGFQLWSPVALLKHLSELQAHQPCSTTSTF